MNATLNATLKNGRRSLLWLALLLAALLFEGTAVPLRAQPAPTCAADAVVQAGDTLSLLAGRLLGSSSAYPQIVAATNAKAATDASYATIANPGVIGVGWKLCIPAALPTGATPVATATAAAAATVTAPTVASTTVASTTVASTTVASTTVASTTVASTAVTSTTLDSANATAGPPVVTPITTPTAAEREAMQVARMTELQVVDMRRQRHTGSNLVVEQALAPGVNYSRSVVSYQSDGLKIFALLTVPNGPRPATGWPVIIFNHGYIPPEIYRTTERYVAYVDGFARSGYIVLRSDYRGHGFSEGEADGAYSTPDYTVDILNAVASIKRYAEADPNRIGMWGHSMGGSITLRTMVTTGDIKAGVIWAGVVVSYADLFANWDSQDVPWRAQALPWRQLAFATYGEPAENPTFWNAISPNSYLADLSGPIQLHHGTLDADVPLAYSTTLTEEIQAVDGQVELYVYEGDNHNLSVFFSTAMARSLAFFDAHVKGATP